MTPPRAPPSSLIRIMIPARLPSLPPISVPSSTTHVSFVLRVLPVVTASVVPAVAGARLVILFATVVWVSLRSIRGPGATTAAAESVALIIVVCFVELVRPVTEDPRVVVKAAWHRDGAAEENAGWALCCCDEMLCRGLFVAVGAKRALPGRCLRTWLDRSGGLISL